MTTRKNYLINKIELLERKRYNLLFASCKPGFLIGGAHTLEEIDEELFEEIQTLKAELEALG